MTQEEKHLLLLDLCARLPYGTFAQWHHKALNKFRNVKIMKISTYGKNIDSAYGCIPFSEENKWELITSWSEKDENMFSRLWETLDWVKESNYSLIKSVKEYIHWLQSLKQRLNGYGN